MLGIFGLSLRTDERRLEEELGRFGKLEKVTVVYDRRVRDHSPTLPSSPGALLMPICIRLHALDRPLAWLRLRDA